MSKENDYNELENQIGEMGGEEKKKGTNLGKLKHPESYGGKKELDKVSNHLWRGSLHAPERKLI